MRLLAAWIVAVTVLACVAVHGQPSGGADGWRQAERGRALHFPEDHASHPEYRIEWWYYTGHVAAEDGRRFGYQLTFFRVGVDPQPANPSRWAVRDLYMTHLAVTDIDRGRHLHAERLNRAGIGWAGAETARYRVWNEDWSVVLEDGRHRLAAVTRGTNPFGVELQLGEGKPPVLHGDLGFSQKGTSPGNASHYYSLTRMPTSGVVTLEGERIPVTGESWMDHEFGTSFLEPSQAGWDWFSLQLDDGSELMVFQLRGVDATVDPRSSGTIVRADGTSATLDAGDFTLTPRRTWRSPATAAAYPIEWRIQVPRERLDMTVRAAVEAQEMTGAGGSGISYWEGAIAVTGTRDTSPITGRGYLEMTGYAGRAMGEFLGGERD